MGEEGLKLYANKPKKAQLKQLQREQGSPSIQSSSSIGTQRSSKAPPPPPPPQPPRESFARRYKFVWPLLLAVNLAIGAYLFVRTKKKDTTLGEVPDVSTSPGPTTAATVPVSEKTLSPLPITAPTKICEPIPENQQRELFKWLLEEKRKVKPKDSEEKKRIDDEKAIIKQFIRAKSIPSL